MTAKSLSSRLRREPSVCLNPCECFLGPKDELCVWDHINMFLSKLGYSELVQRLFEKMTFFLVDPLLNFILQALQNSGTALELLMTFLS